MLLRNCSFAFKWPKLTNKIAGGGFLVGLQRSIRERATEMGLKISLLVPGYNEDPLAPYLV